MSERPNATNRSAVVPKPQREDTAKATSNGPAVAHKSVSKRSVSATPIPVAQPKATGGYRARRVHRMVLRVDPWSVLKLSLIFLFCFWLMVMIAVTLMWGAAVSSGTVTNVEDFIATLLSFEEFKLNGDQILRFFGLLGLITVFMGTAISAIMAVLFNLVASLIGGVRFTVIEEESMRRIVRDSTESKVSQPK